MTAKGNHLKEVLSICKTKLMKNHVSYSGHIFNIVTSFTEIYPQLFLEDKQLHQLFMRYISVRQERKEFLLLMQTFRKADPILFEETIIGEIHKQIQKLANWKFSDFANSIEKLINQGLLGELTRKALTSCLDADYGKEKDKAIQKCLKCFNV